MSKVWRTNGAEAKYLENLFREKKIGVNAKPGTVQNKYPMFNGFSAAVFRKNFSCKTKMLS